MQKLYQDKLGDGKIELIKDSGIVDPTTLDYSKVLIFSVVYSIRMELHTYCFELGLFTNHVR